MAEITPVQAQIWKRDTLVLGGNVGLGDGSGGGTVTMVLRRQLSPISSAEVFAMIGQYSVLRVQTSRQLSALYTGTLGLTCSCSDGSLTLSNAWSRQLSQDTTGNIRLAIGGDAGVSVGWQKHGKKNSGSADVKIGPTTFGVSGQYIRQFSSKSQGRVTGKLGSTGVEIEMGGERKLSEHSSAAMFCVLGPQGVSWRLKVHHFSKW
uniref:DNAJC11-like beta-barrel domain-containing protein n=1 Tax=Physcomitrium patens TaxID=3218 RepID=A0A2K1IBR3_PHYPA|nr:hypothetical protein PHYPA_030202 [Physcomitrium patens]